MVGGLGICGRPFCCASFLDDFQPVSIKMAKSQNLSLNPTKISGTCGRLMCCLKYEQDTYEALIRTSPKPESFVDTPEGRGTVVEADILRQRVKVRMESNPETVSVFPNEEVAVLRSGKAKKSDPPIPSDLAPISGSGVRQKPERKEEETMVLEPIRFRYSTESVVEEPEERPQREAADRPQKPKRKPRGPRPEGKEQKDAKEAPRPEAKPQPEGGDRRPDRRRPRPDRPAKENRPAAQEAPQEGEKRTEQKPRRRGNYRNYRKNKGTPGNNQGNSAE